MGTLAVGTKTLHGIKRVPNVVTYGQQYNIGEKPTVILLLLLFLLFLAFSALVANTKKLLYTVANPARGLLNREKRTKEKVWLYTTINRHVGTPKPNKGQYQTTSIQYFCIKSSRLQCSNMV